MLDKEDASIINISSMNAYTPPDQDPGIQRGKGGDFQLYPMAGGSLFPGRNPLQRHCARLFVTAK